jgi:hypothetical protein
MDGAAGPELAGAGELLEGELWLPKYFGAWWNAGADSPTENRPYRGST